MVLKQMNLKSFYLFKLKLMLCFHQELNIGIYLWEKIQKLLIKELKRMIKNLYLIQNFLNSFHLNSKNRLFCFKKKEKCKILYKFVSKIYKAQFLFYYQLFCLSHTMFAKRNKQYMHNLKIKLTNNLFVLKKIPLSV